MAPPKAVVAAIPTLLLIGAAGCLLPDYLQRKLGPFSSLCTLFAAGGAWRVRSSSRLSTGTRQLQPSEREEEEEEEEEDQRKIIRRG